MKSLLITVIVSALLAMTGGVPTALAHSSFTSFEHGGPVGECPQPFILHHVADHDHDSEHPHKHIGTDTDKNGDGYICVKHVEKDGNNHVHIANNVPL